MIDDDEVGLEEKSEDDKTRSTGSADKRFPTLPLLGTADSEMGGRHSLEEGSKIHTRAHHLPCDC